MPLPLVADVDDLRRRLDLSSVNAFPAPLHIFTLADMWTGLADDKLPITPPRL
jgi:hypothetical protein